MLRLSLLSISVCFILSCSNPKPSIGNDYSRDIRLNQIGYYPKSPKKAIIKNASDFVKFQVIDVEKSKTLFNGSLSENYTWNLAGEKIKVADFSKLEQKGNYVVYIEGLGYSYPFEIKEKVLNEAFRASVKSLYYQRSSMALEKKYAGKWFRALGHPDDSVMFHPSSGKKGIGKFPRGWYDAGDFGKYVVNGAFSLGQMLTLYEQYPEVLADNSLNIPESGNGIPDILDELKYEMDWLLSMQDDDGGVFFKLTTKKFEGMVLPESATQQRYIIGKGTSSSLDFAAVAAQFSRLYKAIDSTYSEVCLEASKKAWKWAVDNPNKNFKNPDDILTGEYGDTDFAHEFYWAASELFISTRAYNYKEYLEEHQMDYSFKAGESWTVFMHYLGAFSLIENLDEDNPLIIKLKKEIVKEADKLVNKAANNDYFQPIDDFQWGSNSDVLNAAMIIAQAHRIKPKQKYLNTILEITDYIFGKNATGYSFLTGFGKKTPQFIHHRQSSGDTIVEPVPGLLSGGPNIQQQDKGEVSYPKNVAPMNSWIDQEPSYASNEICLNWNSAAIYILGFLEQEIK